MNELPDYFDGVIELLITYIEQGVDSFAMQMHGGGYEYGPYVQALHEHDNILMIEAMSYHFFDPPLSEAGKQAMLFMGWRFYSENYLPNYTQFIDLAKVSPREIAIIMVRALHFAFEVDDSYTLEIKPILEAARPIVEALGLIHG